MPDTQEITLGTATVATENREATAIDAEELREVIGVAVPYGVTVDLGNGVRERFEPGAFSDAQPGVTVRSYGHGAAIGRVVELSEKPDGLYYRAKLSRTPLADEAWTLVRDQVLHSASIGFAPVIPDGSAIAEDGTVVRKRARLIHLSLTGEPSYPTAKVLAHREAMTTIDGHSAPENTENREQEMPDVVELADDVATIRTTTEDLQRTIDAIRTQTAPPAPVAGAQFRSAGEWLKAVAKGEESALELARRDFTLASESGIQPAFLAPVIRLVENGRVSLSAFSRAPLPSTGMSAEYVELDADTTQVGKQAAEGDVLPYGEVHLKVTSADIDTYGGWSALSRQAVERSQVNVVDLAYKALVSKYASATNAAFRTFLGTAASTTQALGATLAAGTAAQWDAAIVNAEISMASNGLSLPAEFVLTSSDVFLKLKSLRVSDNPFLGTVGAETPTVGSVNPLTLRGVINGLPLLVDPTLANGSAFVANSNALQTLESGGPTRLSDEDITNLTKQYSVYSYVAFTKPAAVAGIRKITFSS